jgi:hypothetical protein
VFLDKKKGEELAKAGTGTRGGYWDLLFIRRERDRGGPMGPRQWGLGPPLPPLRQRGPVVLGPPLPPMGLR